MITGDRNLLKEGSEAYKRLALQRGVVERLDVAYFGHGALFAALRAKGPYDVVTAQDPLWRGLVGWIAARRLGAKLNVQVHMDLSSLSLVHHVLAQLVLRHADTVRVVSKMIKGQVERIGARGRITVLPVYVDARRFHSVVKRPHSGKNIVWVGRYEKEKDPLAAIAILREVMKEIPDVRLKMIGSGSMTDALVAAAADMPVDELKSGWQDPAAFLDTADAVLCTSPAESWGASIVEALAAGVPVVAPDVGIAKEAGAIVVPRETLAEALVKVLQSDARGKLALSLAPADEWAVQWRNSLL